MLVPLLALAPPAYRIVDLGARPWAEVEAIAINNRGEVLVKSAARAFLWRDGRLLGLGEPPENPDEWGVEPRGLNDLGAVVGGFGHYAAVFGTGLPGSEAFLWKGRGLQRLFQNGRLAEARSINDRGDVVGRDFERGFLWSGGKAREIPALSHVAAGNRADAVAINGKGLILGNSTYGGGTKAAYDLPSRPYLASLPSLRPRPLPLPNGCANAWALGLNDHGVVLARADYAGSRFAPYLVREGRIARLAYPEAKYLEASLNNQGDIVGTISPMDRGSSVPQRSSRPVLWLAGHRVPFPTFPGWKIQSANGINDHGAICGTGLHGGKTRAYVLVPFRGLGGRR